jgi:hypothetical protein
MAIPDDLQGPLLNLGRAGYKNYVPNLITSDLLPSRFIDLADARHLPFKANSLRAIDAQRLPPHPICGQFLQTPSGVGRGKWLPIEPWITVWSH